MFAVSLDLTPGEYSYKFYVDNDWKINNNQVTFRFPFLYKLSCVCVRLKYNAQTPDTKHQIETEGNFV